MSHRTRPAPFVVVAAVETGLSVTSAARDAGYVGPILLVSCDPALPTGGRTAGTLRWLRESCVDVILGARTERVDARRRVILVRGHGEVPFGRLVVDPASLGGDAQVPHLDQATGVEVLPGSSVADAQGSVRRLLADTTAFTTRGGERHASRCLPRGQTGTYRSDRAIQRGGRHGANPGRGENEIESSQPSSDRRASSEGGPS